MISRNIAEISTELEFILQGADASQIIANNHMPIVGEINPRDVVELNVSRAKNISELNVKTSDLIEKLKKTASQFRGSIYGGSLVLEDLSTLSPKRHRTTSLSESCARGFLGITSQQLVLGVTNSELGFEIYNFFRGISPVILALTASSPHTLNDDTLESSQNQSIRISQYKELCRFFPESMWKSSPALFSFQDYQNKIQSVSRELLERLEKGQLDANWEELRKERRKNFAYYPFSILEPHQVYWFVRPRPDHRNIESGGESVFSVEIRAPDMPTTAKRILMVNALIAGLAYNLTDQGYFKPNIQGTFEELEIAARDGLDGKINGLSLRTVAQGLYKSAINGLRFRGYNKEEQDLSLMEKVFTSGNDATLIRRENFRDPYSLKQYLVKRMEEGE